MVLKVFIDTEFTDFIDTHLISIGMAAELGQEFYAEVPYPDKSCSAFVREAVIPLLGRLPNCFYTLEELQSQIVSWLEQVKNGNQDIEICYDYQTDWDLFADVLDYRIPSWCRARLVAHHIDEVRRDEFHRNNQLPEHHALYDALANRHAFREYLIENSSSIGHSQS